MIQQEEPMHWLYPANIKYYDVIGAFSQPETYWPISSKVEVGDIVLIYLAVPYKQIGFVCRILDVGIDMDLIMNNVLFPAARKKPQKT